MLRSLLDRRRRALLAVDRQRMAWTVAGSAGPAADAGELDRESFFADPPSVLRHLDVEVVVAADLAVHWMQTPPRGCRSLAELKAATMARCTQLHGGAAEDWTVAGDWDAHRPFVAAAVPAVLVARVSASLSATGSGRRLTWHTVWSHRVREHASALPDAGWTALRTCNHILLWRSTSGRVTSIQTLCLPATESASEVLRAAGQHAALEDARDGEAGSGESSSIRLLAGRWPGAATNASEASSCLAPVHLQPVGSA